MSSQNKAKLSANKSDAFCGEVCRVSHSVMRVCVLSKICGCAFKNSTCSVNAVKAFFPNNSKGLKAR
jgi:hypothetical protein